MMIALFIFAIVRPVVRNDDQDREGKALEERSDSGKAESDSDDMRNISSKRNTSLNQSVNESANHAAKNYSLDDAKERNKIDTNPKNDRTITKLDEKDAKTKHYEQHRKNKKAPKNQKGLTREEKVKVSQNDDISSKLNAHKDVNDEEKGTKGENQEKIVEDIKMEKKAPETPSESKQEKELHVDAPKRGGPIGLRQKSERLQHMNENEKDEIGNTIQKEDLADQIEDDASSEEGIREREETESRQNLTDTKQSVVSLAIAFSASVTIIIGIFAVARARNVHVITEPQAIRHEERILTTTQIL